MTPEFYPNVSVIVPILNGERYLGKLISALKAQDYPHEKLEVILVDNASTDQTPDIIRETDGQLFKAAYEINGSSYAARNRGAKTARGDIFAFTDVDCLPTADWVSSGVMCMQKRQFDVLSGRVDQQSEGRPNLFQVIDHTMYLRQSWYKQQGFGATANLFARRHVFEELSGFDDRLSSSGDRVFCHRSIKAGYRFGYCHEAVVFHETRTSITGIAGREIRISHGFGQTARLYKGYDGWRLFGQTYLPLEGIHGCLHHPPNGIPVQRVLIALVVYAVIRIPCRTYGFVSGMIKAKK